MADNHKQMIWRQDEVTAEDYEIDQQEQTEQDLHNYAIFKEMSQKAHNMKCTCSSKSKNIFQAVEMACLHCCDKHIVSTEKIRDGKTALKFAASLGHLEVVKYLIFREVNLQIGDGMTALMWAAKNGHLDVVECLSHHEAEMQDNDGWTALMWAALNNHLQIVQLLTPLESKMQSDIGLTALMIAAEHGHLEVAKLLLPLEVEIQRYDGWTALMNAAWHDHADCVSLLLPYQAGMKSESGRTAACQAALHMRRESLALLLNDEREAREVPRQMLAAYRGDLKTMLEMQGKWMKIFCKDVTILHFAFVGGSERCIQILLRDGGMQYFSSNKQFNFECMKDNPIREINCFLPAIIAQSECRISDHIVNLFFYGKKMSLRALMPFCSFTRGLNLKQMLQECESAEDIVQLLKLAKNPGFIFCNKTLLDLSLKCKEELINLISQNPLWLKQIELATKQITRNATTDKKSKSKTKKAKLERQFACREFSQKTTFNRFILIISREICWKSISSQRRPRDHRTCTIKAKVRMTGHMISYAWKFLAKVVKAMLEE